MFTVLGPGNVTAYLEVVDLMQGKLRFIPVPEPAQMSVYASWYKQTYPDQIVACSETSNEGLGKERMQVPYCECFLLICNSNTS